MLARWARGLRFLSPTNSVSALLDTDQKGGYLSCALSGVELARREKDDSLQIPTRTSKMVMTAAKNGARRTALRLMLSVIVCVLTNVVYNNVVQFTQIVYKCYETRG